MLAADGHRFFVERQRLGAAAEVAVDLGDAFERFDQFAARAALARLSSPPRRIARALLRASRTASAFRVHESDWIASAARSSSSMAGMPVSQSSSTFAPAAMSVSTISRWAGLG